MAVPFSKPVTITRRQLGYYEDDATSEAFGFWIQPEATETVINACIQPFIARTDADVQTMQRLGVDGIDGLVRIYSQQAIYKTEGDQLGDRFIWEGRLYEVCDVSTWPGPRPHWKGFAALVTDTINIGHSEPPEPDPEPEP